jgi:hypothetical protein
VDGNRGGARHWKSSSALFLFGANRLCAPATSAPGDRNVTGLGHAVCLVVLAERALDVNHWWLELVFSAGRRFR